MVVSLGRPGTKYQLPAGHSLNKPQTKTSSLRIDHNLVESPKNRGEGLSSMIVEIILFQPAGKVTLAWEKFSIFHSEYLTGRTLLSITTLCHTQLTSGSLAVQGVKLGTSCQRI